MSPTVLHSPRCRGGATIVLSLVLLTYSIICGILAVESFVVPAAPTSSTQTLSQSMLDNKLHSSTTLFATKKKKKKRPGSANANNASGGFGGAALETCPCGSGETYGNCCGRLHRDVNAYRTATPEQVVRARYSAYAKKQADFLMASTHPLHKDFNTDLKQWKKTIKTNMYDNFDMPQCTIVSETIGIDSDDNDDDEDTTATVQFIAKMVLRESGETTSFMETSLFERAKTHGAWLYKNGTIEAAPGSEVAMETSSNDGSVGGEEDGSVETKLASML